MPYKDRYPDLRCPSNLKLWKHGAKVTSYLADWRLNEDNLKKLVYEHGAVTVGIAASDDAFMHYKDGIISGCKRDSAKNHAVTIIGYGSERGIPFWIGKNSWSENRGEKGFFRIRRGNNECKVEEDAVTTTCGPIGESDPPPPTPPPKKIPVDL